MLAPQAAGQGQRPRGFQHAAGFLEHVLDRGADGVGVDHDEVVHVFAGEAVGFLAHELDGGAVGEEADVGQGDAAAFLHALDHGVGVDGLYADDADLGAQLLDVGGHAGNQAAAADGDEDGVDGTGVLAQDLHAYGALAGDDVRVVEGVDEGELFLRLQLLGVVVGVGEAFAVQHDFGLAGKNGVDLELGGGDRHDDDGPAAHALGRQRDALGVVARGGGDDAALERLGREVGHLVVGTPQLEAENGLGVFPFEQHRVRNSRRNLGSGFEGGLDSDVVDFGGEYAFEIVGGHDAASGVGGKTVVL